ncbi:TetR/AcrR family transcriptional regulator [Nocardioides soli]|uniref:AcrR family transcriptional regulator n=1 Tax=Nocardioides soli TaxID=1036020 RepID=A0A7W4VW49_9ACTN|nr:TetR/AcrR family transcriptional regulator [Nocardioides soli]MBB3042863.1 AcrR family transcriptional regulator [Nocardioides soli]
MAKSTRTGTPSGLEAASAPDAEPPDSALMNADALAGLSAKGLRTRKRLLEGARSAFEKKGSYVETRISDIVKESGVAYGSFYTYFESKEALFYELAVEVVHEMYVEGTSRYRGDNPLERIDASNRQFLDSYRRHAAMMTIIEQAAALYPEFRALRRRLRQGFVDRIAANFERLSSARRMDTSIDPVIAAHALVSMTDNFGYLWFVLGESFDDEKALTTLTQLWGNSLGLRRS